MSSRFAPPITAPVYQAEDFTTFLTRDVFKSQVGRDECKLIRAALAVGKHYEEEISLEGTVTKASSPIQGRSLICPCYAGEYYSITIRAKKAEKLPKPAAGKPGDNYADSGYAESRKHSPTSKYPFLIPWLCEPFVSFRTNKDDSPERLLPDPWKGHPWSGAILITGATGTCKTQVASGLVHNYLSHLRLRPGRRPHLVTVEKPIEVWLSQDPETAKQWGIDYTPRLLDVDAPDLRTALMDALRQKPAVVYLGELRTDDELKDLLWFAGTGHLVVATAHAGSLIEAMDKLLRAGHADTPARREQVAKVLSAVIHLRARSFPKTDPKSAVVLPAAWIRTLVGLEALVTDGLDSLLPHVARRNGGASCFGRLYFAKRLFEQYQIWSKANLKRPDLLNPLESEIWDQAIQWDLQGV